MRYPTSGEELLKIFGNIQAAGYFQPVVLKDTKAGFSIQKYFPSNIRFKPAKTKAGVDDSVACIWVVYQSETELKNVSLVPIRFRIALMSRYRAKHLFDEDDMDDDRPTPESQFISKNSPQPIDLIFRQEYFYDTHSMGLVDKNGKEITGTEILEKIFNSYCETVHRVKGLRVRSEEMAQRVSRGVLESLINGCIWSLKKIFGRTLNERTDRSSYFDGYRGQDFGKLQEDCFEVLGYKVPVRVFLLFVGMMVAIAYVFYPLSENQYALIVLQNEALVTLHSIS